MDICKKYCIYMQNKFESIIHLFGINLHVLYICSVNMKLLYVNLHIDLYILYGNLDTILDTLYIYIYA